MSTVSLLDSFGEFIGSSSSRYRVDRCIHSPTHRRPWSRTYIVHVAGIVKCEGYFAPVKEYERVHASRGATVLRYRVHEIEPPRQPTLRRLGAALHLGKSTNLYKHWLTEQYPTCECDSIHIGRARSGSDGHCTTGAIFCT